MYLKVDKQANWDEKYLTEVDDFSHVNLGLKVSPHEISHLISTAPSPIHTVFHFDNMPQAKDLSNYSAVLNCRGGTGGGSIKIKWH